MFNFRPSNIPSNIFVVGCGGTGSRLIPALVQFIRSCTKEHNPRGWLGSTNIVLIDGDVVEQKNLLRQNFVQSDVGKNKAAVLANRYSKAYGMNVIPYTKYIAEDTTSYAFRGDLNETTGLDVTSRFNDMVIMCVDSAKARRIVFEAFATPYDNRTVFIDAGNEDSFGQVRMFHNVVLTQSTYDTAEEARKHFKNPERLEHMETLDYIPFDYYFYRDLEDNPGLGSCADLDQTLAINSLMAMYILSFVQNHYFNKAIDYNAVSIDIVKGSTSFVKNTIVEYRNKMIHAYDDRYQIGNGPGTNSGMLGSCFAMDGYHVVSKFIKDNKKALDTLLAQQAAPVLDTEIDVTVEPAKKKRTKTLKPVIQVEPMIVELAPVEFNTTAEDDIPDFGLTEVAPGEYVVEDAVSGVDDTEHPF